MSPRHGHEEHEGWDALAVGYALSALEPDEEAVFLAHLADCDRCPETVAEALRTVGDLALVVPEEIPPPDLRARLMAAVAAEPRTGAAPLPGGSPGHDGPSYPPGAGPAGPPSAPGSLGPAAPPSAPYGAPVTGPAGPYDAPGSPSQRGPGRADPRVPGVSPSTAVGEPGPGTLSGPPLPRTPGLPGAPDRTGAPDRPGGRGRHAAWDADGGRVVPFRTRAARQARRAVAVAAAVVLLAALGVWNLRLRADQDELRRTVAQREAVIEELTKEGPARVAALESTSVKGRRLLTIVVRTGGVDVVSEALTPNDVATSKYWLWGLAGPTDPTPTPILGFDVSEPGVSVRTVLSNARELDVAALFAISRENGLARPEKPANVLAAGAAR